MLLVHHALREHVDVYKGELCGDILSTGVVAACQGVMMRLTQQHTETQIGSFYEGIDRR